MNSLNNVTPGFYLIGVTEVFAVASQNFPTGVFTPVEYDNETVDTLDCFDYTTDPAVFTLPEIDGYYRFKVGVSLSNPSGSKFIKTRFYDGADVTIISLPQTCVVPSGIIGSQFWNHTTSSILPIPSALIDRQIYLAVYHAEGYTVTTADPGSIRACIEIFSKR